MSKQSKLSIPNLKTQDFEKQTHETKNLKRKRSEEEVEEPSSELKDLEWSSPFTFEDTETSSLDLGCTSFPPFTFEDYFQEMDSTLVTGELFLDSPPQEFDDSLTCFLDSTKRTPSGDSSFPSEIIDLTLEENEIIDLTLD
jgi:hypothetical protein